MIRKILLITLSFMIVLIPILYAATNDVTDSQNSPKKTLPSISAGKFVGDYDYTFKRKERSRDLLWSQIPTPANGWACQLDTVYPFVADICDDVDPSEAWVIDSVISWHWNFGAWSSWTLVPFIEFIVYNDNGSTWPEDSAFIKVRVPQSNYTAYLISGTTYYVEMQLPTPVTLPAGIKYWVEIRPCTDFSVNGQTGAMCDVGHGNGQELYFRMPVLGVMEWVTATTQWGIPGELGFELYGTVVGADTNDVGTIAIVLPGDSIMPDSSVYPTATYRNFGTVTETFEVHFDIDTGGVFLYQETQTMILAAGLDSTYAFPTLWTAGPGEGVIYNLTVYTILAGDIDPTNDTLTSTTIAVGVAEEPGKLSPLVFGLSQNIPNPARNGYTEISYTTTSKGPVSLKIYDVTGKLVRTLRDIANDPAGSRTVYWDMKDNNHNPTTAGVYFYRLTADGKTATGKMVIVR